MSLFRFSLALMVMAIHLGGQLPAQLGRVAVEAFFCISGFLITMVANGRYAGRPLAFVANRALRIYPTYWVCLMVAFIIVTTIPHGEYLHPSLYVPVSSADRVANIAIFGLTQQTASRLLPAAWSLQTELWFYGVIGLVTASRRRLTLVLLASSTVLSASAASNLIHLEFYGDPLGNAYAFFLGSTVWHYRSCFGVRIAHWCLVLGLMLFEALAWIPATHFPTLMVFLAAPATATFLVGLWNLPRDAWLGPCRALCAFLGRLAYPIFLLHWPAGLLVYHWSGAWHDWQMFAGSAIVSMVGATLIVLLLEMPLEKWRAQIRSVPDAALDSSVVPEAAG